jgi:putative ABC transport system substrate-binding protein
MKRRDFITGLLLTTAVPSSQAQQPRKVHRIGFLWLGAPGTDDTPRQGLVQGLRALGYVEGENLIIEYRYAGERPERLPELAAELVRLNVDLIRTPGTLVTRAAQQATRTIPIVTTAADLVSNGFVASLARPGGNVTGVSLSSGPEIAGKRLQILKEVRPDMQWVGYLWERDNSGSATDLTYLEQISRDFHVSVKAISVSRSE